MELKIVGTRNQFSDAGLDVVEGVGERCQLLHRVLLPLVRRRPTNTGSTGATAGACSGAG